MSVASVHIVKRLSVRADVVFDAWTLDNMVKLWLFKSDTNEILHVKTDLQPGGAFSILEQSDDGSLIDHFGRYHQIERPHHLSFSLEAPKHFSGVTEVDIHIMPTAGGCELTFDQTGVDPQIVEESWHKMFNRLDKVLNNAL